MVTNALSIAQTRYFISGTKSNFLLDKNKLSDSKWFCPGQKILSMPRKSIPCLVLLSGQNHSCPGQNQNYHDQNI